MVRLGDGGGRVQAGPWVSQPEPDSLGRGTPIGMPTRGELSAIRPPCRRPSMLRLLRQPTTILHASLVSSRNMSTAYAQLFPAIKVGDPPMGPIPELVPEPPTC